MWTELVKCANVHDVDICSWVDLYPNSLIVDCKCHISFITFYHSHLLCVVFWHFIKTECHCIKWVAFFFTIWVFIFLDLVEWFAGKRQAHYCKVAFLMILVAGGSPGLTLAFMWGLLFNVSAYFNCAFGLTPIGLMVGGTWKWGGPRLLTLYLVDCRVHCALHCSLFSKCNFSCS